MNKKLYFPFLFSLILFLGAFGFYEFSYAQNNCRSDVRGFCIKSNLPDTEETALSGNKNLYAQVGKPFVVPGLEFLKLDANSSLGDILIRIYTFALGLVGLSALLMLIFGGVRYATATESGIKQAKEWMTNALVGLALALLSWLILFVINPDFVQKLTLKLEPITPTPAKPICLEGANCFGSVTRCPGLYSCNTDGTVKECKETAGCKTDTKTICNATIACADGVNRSFSKDFKKAEFCNTKCTQEGIAPYLKNACPAGEFYVIRKIQCGTD